MRRPKSESWRAISSEEKEGLRPELEKVFPLPGKEDTDMTAPSTTLLAGASQVDITPPAGTHLAGAVGLHRPARLVLDPLYAKALVLEIGGRRLGILALDVTIVTAEYTARIREAAQRRLGIPHDALMVHATQTHSAPALGRFMLDPALYSLVPPDAQWMTGCEEQYADWAAEQAVAALEAAAASLEPVDVGVASAIDGRWAHNRRAVRSDGTVAMPGPIRDNPLGPTWIRYLEGPIDPEVGVVAFRRRSGRLLALLLNYGCHPVHVFPRLLVSADWPGAWADEVRRQLGYDCVPIVLNGPCGNVNPWDPYDPHYRCDHRVMGRGLAETTASVLESMEFSPVTSLDCRTRCVPVAVREVEPERLTWARSILEESPTPRWANDAHSAVDWDWMIAASIYGVHLLREREGAIDYEVQVLRIGNTALVGLPGEPFAELGLAVKMASPARHTYVAHCTSHYVGYIPTPEAIVRGGHECETRYWAKLVPDAYHVIISSASEVLREVFGQVAES